MLVVALGFISGEFHACLRDSVQQLDPQTGVFGNGCMPGRSICLGLQRQHAIKTGAFNVRLRAEFSEYI